MEALRELKAANAEQVHMDSESYGTVVLACVESSQWIDAMNLLGRMDEYAIEPDVMTFSLWLSVFAWGTLTS